MLENTWPEATDPAISLKPFDPDSLSPLVSATKNGRYFLTYTLHSNQNSEYKEMVSVSTQINGNNSLQNEQQLSGE